MSAVTTFPDLPTLAQHLRQELDGRKEVKNDGKKFILIYAFNGTGKTRLSMAFKDAGKRVIKTPVQFELEIGKGEKKVTHKGDDFINDTEGGDTLYFNAFTEDLFSWDNDLTDDSDRCLKLNFESRFFDGLKELELESRIRPFLHRYVDFDFEIDYASWSISFSRTIKKRAATGEETSERVDGIKVSRGEENIFIWCFFLAIVQLAMDGAEAYKWVKYIYIDDPISSLDENNAIAVASNLAQLLKQTAPIKAVISSHHPLFYNVMSNELSKARQLFLSHGKQGSYDIRDMGDAPFFHHVAALVELYEVAQSGQLYTHHFNMLRAILEKTATFHGYKNFSACFKDDPNDHDGVLKARLINILSHGNYSLYEPREMLEENKEYFRQIIRDLLERYPFNPDLIKNTASEETLS